MRFVPTTTTPSPQEAAVTITTTHHTTTVAQVEGDTYRIECTCGERVNYRFEAFTVVEAERHARWHEKVGR